MKLRTIVAAVIAVLLIGVDWLAFHDLAEVHTLRDWLTLLASVLVLIYLAWDIASQKSIGPEGT
ncbi:MAG TPA: hypothetical protein VEU77_00370 [Candidatus Acidoferrales bacterium]|nr:hypothetical protein [Candidatus Acidoferrales bacterium]